MDEAFVSERRLGEGPDDLDDAILIKHMFWEDPQGNVLGMIASPHGVSIAIQEAGNEVGTAVSLRGETVPDFTRFLMECAVQFGKIWRAKENSGPTASG